MDHPDQIFAKRLEGAVRAHQQMLADGVRNRLLYDVLRDLVTKQTRFLDIGSGTGVWAILAAKLGARRVVAVEIEECLIPIIYQHARENGVADKIEIIQGNSDDVEIRGKFDLIVSEFFGFDIYGAKTINSLVSIRERFLAPDGTLIPQKIEKYAVPVRIENPPQNAPADLPVTFNFIRSLSLNFLRQVSYSNRKDLEFLADPQKLLAVDLRTVSAPPPLKDLAATWQLKDLSKANAFAVYIHSKFTDDVEMDSFDSQSWIVGIYQFDPFPVKESGEIRFSITLIPKQFNWKISLPSHPHLPTQNYSPGFGSTRTRMAQKTTPHQKFPAKK